MRVDKMPFHGWLATPTRRNAIKGILIAPSLMMMGVAAQSKPTYVDFDVIASNADADKRITAYIDVVRDTEKVTKGPKADPLAVRKVAQKWVSQSKQGKLLRLVPEAATDIITNGVKGQILDCTRGITRHLATYAESQARKGDFDGAAGSLTLAMEVLQPIRYSDVVSVAVTGSIQHRLMRQLEPIWDKVQPNTKAKLRGDISMLRGDAAMFQKTLKTERRLAAIEDIRRLQIASDADRKYEIDLTFSGSITMAARSARRLEKEAAMTVSDLLAG